MAELGRRLAVAAIGIPTIVGFVYVGDAALATFLGAVAGAGAWEVFRLARAAGHDPLDEIGIVLAASVPLLAHAYERAVFDTPLAAVAVVLLAVFAAAIWMRGPGRKPLAGVAITVFGILYPACITFGYSLRHHPYAVGAAAGTALLLFPVTLTWANDTAAFAVGRSMGKHKLIPSVSPGKTVEGTIGGLAGALAFCWGYVHYILMPVAHLALAPGGVAIFAVLVSVAALLGDLGESLLKREAGVKDSSGLLPGHGGMLDRVDSLLFVLPVALLLLNWLLIPVPFA